MSRSRAIALGWFLLGLSFALLALGVCVGSLGFENLWQPLLDSQAPQVERDMAWHIVTDIRLPRTLGAWTAGALLGLAGALAQGLFRNPLADPYLLGSASGASLGVALMLAALGAGTDLADSAWVQPETVVSMFSGSLWVRLGLTGAAFGGAVIAVLLTLALARGVGHTMRLLLAGVVVGVVLGALTSLVMLFSPSSLQAMQAFLLGSTSFVGWNALALMASVWLLASAVAWPMARVLDGLSLGEATAASLGLPLRPLRAALVGVLAMATATAVAQTGLIAFVGLAAPHLVRARLSVGHARFVGLSMLAGGVLLCAADVLARGLLAPRELPVGVVTAVIGGIYLLRLMRQPMPGGRA